MPDWLDSDTLIQPSRTYYSFALVPSFWSYLDRKVQEQVFAAPERVFGELKEVDDDLNAWATNVQESFFRQPSEEVQRVFGQIADSVKADHRFAQQPRCSFSSESGRLADCPRRRRGRTCRDFRKARATVNETQDSRCSRSLRGQMHQSFRAAHRARCQLLSRAAPRSRTDPACCRRECGPVRRRGRRPSGSRSSLASGATCCRRAGSRSTT